MKKSSFVALLLVGATILGGTVLREPIARAAQTVDAKIIGPLDGQGNVAVHEQGTAAVSVTNLPSEQAVRDVDSPALQPYVRGVDVAHIPDNSSAGVDTFPVPVGKRLVIQHVSGRVTLPTGQKVVDVGIGVIGQDRGPVRFHHLLPHFVTSDVGVDRFEFGEPVAMYANGGTTVEFSVLRRLGDATGEGFFDWTVTGYLIDS